jgi:hypothetical protein
LATIRIADQLQPKKIVWKGQSPTKSNKVRQSLTETVFFAEQAQIARVFEKYIYGALWFRFCPRFCQIVLQILPDFVSGI